MPVTKAAPTKKPAPAKKPAPVNASHRSPNRSAASQPGLSKMPTKLAPTKKATVNKPAPINTSRRSPQRICRHTTRSRQSSANSSKGSCKETNTSHACYSFIKAGCTETNTSPASNSFTKAGNSSEHAVNKPEPALSGRQIRATAFHPSSKPALPVTIARRNRCR